MQDLDSAAKASAAAPATPDTTQALEDTTKKLAAAYKTLHDLERPSKWKKTKPQNHTKYQYRS